MHSELCEEKKPVNVYKLGELNDRDHQFSLNLMTLSISPLRNTHVLNINLLVQL